MQMKKEPRLRNKCTHRLNHMCIIAIGEQNSICIHPSKKRNKFVRNMHEIIFPILNNNQF